jgi:putative sterol carrier protein
MIPFPSDQWAQRFKDALNANINYKTKAANWEGDFLFIITPDNAYPHELKIYLNLWHGTCQTAQFTNDHRQTAYTLTGPYTIWKQIIQGTLDPLRAIVRGCLSVQGDSRKIMDYAHAAQELVATAARIPTAFEDTQ